MYLKEITVLCGKSGDKKFYRFFKNEDGKMKEMRIEKKKNQNTTDIFENILTDFIVDKTLVSLSYSTCNPFKHEEYFGIKMQNEKEERLNIYFSSKALYAFQEIETLFQMIKYQDFYEYAVHPIEKQQVEKMTIRPSVDEKSSVVYIFYEWRNSYSPIQKQLGYYYRKSKNKIAKEDIAIICKIIRYFINANLINHPRYEYLNGLKIKCDTKSFIEILDNDLIYELEKARIIDDLWLVMNGIIDKMPLQEDSIKEKEVLKRKRIKYLEEKNFS